MTAVTATTVAASVFQIVVWRHVVPVGRQGLQRVQFTTCPLGHAGGIEHAVAFARDGVVQLGHAHGAGGEYLHVQFPRRTRSTSSKMSKAAPTLMPQSATLNAGK